MPIELGSSACAALDLFRLEPSSPPNSCEVSNKKVRLQGAQGVPCRLGNIAPPMHGPSKVKLTSHRRQFQISIPRINNTISYCILRFSFFSPRYAAILFKKQRYVSGHHRMNIKIVCKENFKYEVQAPPTAPNAVNLQQLAEEYWRIDKFFLISFPILFFIFNIIYWLAFIL